MSDHSEATSARELVETLLKRLKCIDPGNKVLGYLTTLNSAPYRNVEHYCDLVLVTRLAIYEATRALVENKVLELTDNDTNTRTILCNELRRIKGSDVVEVEADGYATYLFIPYEVKNGVLLGLTPEGVKRSIKVIKE